MKTFEQIAELERRYLLGTYNRYPIALTRGKGVFLYDLEDRRYLDFVAGGGGDGPGGPPPPVVETSWGQAGEAIYIPPPFPPQKSGGGGGQGGTLRGRAFVNGA